MDFGFVGASYEAPSITQDAQAPFAALGLTQAEVKSLLG